MSEHFYQHALTLPLFPSLSHEEQLKVVNLLRLSGRMVNLFEEQCNWVRLLRLSGRIVNTFLQQIKMVIL